MKIEQFEEKGFAHYAYAVLSECEHTIVLIDPGRDISPYLDYAARQGARITGVIETHPHADFVSGHLELHQVTGATIYCSRLLGAEYPHQTFDDGDVLDLGRIRLKALNTPGHSPDSICIVLEHEGTDKAVFSGDTLFIGDCGRPDLREKAGSLTEKRNELARQMYHSLRAKLLKLDDSVLVYPAHGAGSLCGKSLSEAAHSTIGAERRYNWSLQEMSEERFAGVLLKDQPFIPKYFSYNVALNKHGAPKLQNALADVPLIDPGTRDRRLLIIDTRPEQTFKKAHLPGSANIQDGGKFETWLGSIIAPEERFYLTAVNDETLKRLIAKAAKIGYETFIAGAFVFTQGEESMPFLDMKHFKANPGSYTVIDLRNDPEVKTMPVFDHALHIPLHELREHIADIPLAQPLVVHCAGGYRSAAGSSLLKADLGNKATVYDLGEAVKEWM